MQSATESTHQPAGSRRPRVKSVSVWNTGEYRDLNRILDKRHIVGISLSGTIGSGIFIFSSGILAESGSAGTFLSYFLVALVVVSVMMCLGEMVSLIPCSGALQEYPTRYVDEALGWTVGIMYFVTYSLGVATLTTSTTRLLRDFFPHFPVAGIITAILALILIVNILGVKVYGEIETFFGLLKALILITAIILMIVIDRGVGPSHIHTDTNNWTTQDRFPPTFNGIASIKGALARFLSVWQGMTNALFSYIGVEIVAVTASEARRPKSDLPKAAQRIFWITATLYVLTAIVIPLNTPFNDPDLTDSSLRITQNSPFVIAAKRSGFKLLPEIMEWSFVVVSWSTANTGLYVASRTLYGMATRVDEKHTWIKILANTTERYVPVPAILCSLIFAPLAYLQCSQVTSITSLGLLDQLETVTCLLVWCAECFTFIKFYNGLVGEGAPVDRWDQKNYPYASWFQPYTAYFGLFGTAVLILFNGFAVFIEKPFKVTNFVIAYLALPVFFGVYGILKLVIKQPCVLRHNRKYNDPEAGLYPNRKSEKKMWISRVGSWFWSFRKED